MDAIATQTHPRPLRGQAVAAWLLPAANAVAGPAAAIVLAAHAFEVRAPELSSLRPLPLLGVLLSALILALWHRWLAARSKGWMRVAARGGFIISVFAAGAALATEGRFQYDRQLVLNTDPAVLERIGPHVMVGYTNPAEIHRLLELKAIGGVFVTRRNAVRRTMGQLRAEIEGFQAIRRRQGLPPLWIAADQEGGSVSKLSPPLTRLPALSSLLQGVQRPDQLDAKRQAAIDDYADRHGRELASIGVNLNFAPVVDVDHGLRNPRDTHSKIGRRAISRNPEVVTIVATRYCEGLAKHGVRCTFKHFPGLGRVFEDTHVKTGKLDTAVATLETSDWMPFSLAVGTSNFAMVGHAILTQVDANSLATTSSEVVTRHLRPRWSGPIITDDLAMAPAWRHKLGVGWAGRQALAAGIDMLLMSWDGAQIYPVLANLTAAVAANEIEGLGAARVRLAAAMPETTATPAR